MANLREAFPAKIWPGCDVLWGGNASTLDQVAEAAAVSTDSRQTGFLITQAESGIEQALSDGELEWDSVALVDYS